MNRPTNDCSHHHFHDVTLTNGVVVPAEEMEKAHQLMHTMVGYAHSVLLEKPHDTYGLLWDLVGYVHGHSRTMPEQWHYTLRMLGVMEPDNTIPPMRQWALVALCCKGERLGEYADEKERL